MMAQHPIKPPAGSTHYLIRRSPGKPELQWPDEHGITQNKFPLEEFDRDTITTRWGFSREFRVQFFEDRDGVFKALGGPRKFGIEGDSLEEPTAEPVAPPGQLGEMLAAAMSIKGIAQEDTRLQVETMRAQNELALQNSREQNAQTLQMLATVMTAARPATADPNAQMMAFMMQQLQNQQQMNQNMVMAQMQALQRRNEPDEEDEEEDSPEERIRQLAQDVRTRGFASALTSYVADQGLEAAFSALPQLEQHIPGILGNAMQFITSKLGIGQQPPAPPPQPQPVYPAYAQPPETFAVQHDPSPLPRVVIAPRQPPQDAPDETEQP